MSKSYWWERGRRTEHQFLLTCVELPDVLLVLQQRLQLSREAVELQAVLEPQLRNGSVVDSVGAPLSILVQVDKLGDRWHFHEKAGSTPRTRLIHTPPLIVSHRLSENISSAAASVKPKAGWSKLQVLDLSSAYILQKCQRNGEHSRGGSSPLKTTPLVRNEGENCFFSHWLPLLSSVCLCGRSPLWMDGGLVES